MVMYNSTIFFQIFPFSTNTDGGLPILPKFYGTMMTYLVSDHAEVVESALATMKVMLFSSVTIVFFNCTIFWYE